MRTLLTVLLFGCASLLGAQTNASPQSGAESQLSPQAAYDQAVQPLEITRRSPKNWSEVELNALKIARENAKTSCSARQPDQFTGEDLLALAHLCAFAQDWQAVLNAASNYVAAALDPDEQKGEDKTALATAFDYQIQASLNLDHGEDALAMAQTMLRSVPYDVFSSEATNSTVEYLRFIHTDQALALLAQRQPMILSLIKAEASRAAGAAHSAGAPVNAHATLSLHALYADAIALPSLQQYANQPDAAEASYAELESALPATVGAEDALYIGQRRSQYLLLGRHLPALKPMGSLISPGVPAPENLNTWFAYASVFLLFPDWCNQCIALGADSAAKANQLRDAFHVRLLLLLAQANPPEKHAQAPVRNVPLAPKSAKATQAQSQQLHINEQLAIKSSPDALLEGTPTVVVPNETLDQFAATDVPLLIATDHNGVVRWTQRVPDDALAPGGDVEQIVRHVVATWPPD